MSQTNSNSIYQRNAEQVLLGKKTNVLLARDEMGRAKPSTRDLPDDSFVFGKADLLPDRDTVDQGKFTKLLTVITISCELMEIPPKFINYKSRPQRFLEA
jgi:hypothetical protein